MHAKRRLFFIALALVALSEVLAWVGIGAGAHHALATFARHGHPALSAALLASAVIFGLRAPRPIRNAALAVGLFVEVGHAVLMGDPALALTNLGGGFG